MFDTITGLPVHPLVVHAAVVLWPIGVLGLLALLLAPRLRDRYGWLTMVCLVVGAIAVYVSKESGEQLAHHIGEPKTHAQYADVLTILTFFTLLLSLLWWFLSRRHARTARVATGTPAVDDGRATGELHGAHAARVVDEPRAKGSALGRLLGLGAGLLGLASLVLTVLVGHTGAEAAWGGRVTDTTTSTPSASASSSSSSAAASTGSYTLAQVATHNTSSSCWVAIKAPGQSTTNVYDLTKWISLHPGGPEAIKGLCGTNGTTAFTQQHGDDGANGEPEQKLAAYKIGTLAG